MKDEIKVKKGKASKAQGGLFELRVRLDLEEKGWICDKWTNQVEFSKWIEQEDTGISFIDKENGIIEMRGKLVKAKPKFVFNPQLKRRVMMGNGAGFPDYLCMRVHIKAEDIGAGLRTNTLHQVIGVESKMTGELDRLEKEKCKWLLDNNIFSKILIASKHKIKNRVHIEYEDFKEKYWRFYEKSKD